MWQENWNKKCGCQSQDGGRWLLCPAPPIRKKSELMTDPPPPPQKKKKKKNLKWQLGVLCEKEYTTNNEQICILYWQIN